MIKHIHKTNSQNDNLKVDLLKGNLNRGLSSETLTFGKLKEHSKIASFIACLNYLSLHLKVDQTWFKLF